MKKALVIVLALCAILAFASCGKSNNDNKSNEAAEQKTEAATKAATDAATDAATETEAAANAEVEVYTGTKSKFVGDTEWTEDEFKLELNGDGTAALTYDGFTHNLTYTLVDDDLSMTEAGLGTEYTGTFNGDELHLYNGDPTNDLTYEWLLAKAD